VVLSAQVKATDVNTGAVRTVRSSSDGRFPFAQVNSGTYRIEVLAEGFGPARSQPTAVAVGQTTTLNFTLSPMTTSQSVEVTAQAGLLSLENPNTSTTYYWTKRSCVLTAGLRKRRYSISDISEHLRNVGHGSWLPRSKAPQTVRVQRIGSIQDSLDLVIGLQWP
jgi:hypothetical protein